MKIPKIAICYDFDSTLSLKDIQSYKYFQELGVTAGEFYSKSDKISETNNADKILINMYMVLEEAKRKGIDLTREKLESYGEDIELFDGVETWFNRINEYGKKLGVDIEHYVVSSGFKDMINGTKIAKYFKKIYACSYLFDENGHPVWPTICVNYTTKTQFLYRINKGILEEHDDSINDAMDEELRSVPFENMIYIGDSFTDIPCMRLVMKSGGVAIGVYNPKENNNQKVKTLIKNNKINFIAPADYSEGKMLEKLVKEILKGIKIATGLKTISTAQKK